MLKPQPYKLIHLIILCLISTLAYGYNPHTLQTHTDYDKAGRISQLRNMTDAQATISHYQYTYDTNGNRSQQIEHQNGFTTEQQQTTDYTYDDNDRLTQIDLLDIDTGTTQRTDIAYWPSFDRQQHTVTHIDTDATQTVQQNRLYTYDDIYRLSTITDQLTGNVIDYTYDNNGNTLNKTDNTQNPVVNTDYTYNPRNHLKTVTQNGQAQGDYHYNYAGTRIHHNRSSRGDITYYHDGTSVIDEHSNGQQYSHYNYAHKLTSLTTQAGTHYYHYAALGTTANLSDSNGNTHASYRTDPFGQITRQQGNSQNRNIFTGHEHDTETGLIYMKARYYDPDAARFLNQDSYLGTPDQAPSLHRYLYAYSNPTYYIDPTGNVAVLENDINEVMAASKDESFDIRSGALLDIAQDQGYDIQIKTKNGGLVNTITPSDLAALKQIIQNALSYTGADQEIRNSHPAFIFVTAEDTETSLRQDVTRALRGYSDKQDLNDIVERVLATQSGNTADISKARTNRVDEINDYYDNKRISKNGSSAGNLLNSVYQNALKSIDTNLPDDIAADAITTTAWNFAPGIGQVNKGTTVLRASLNQLVKNGSNARIATTRYGSQIGAIGDINQLPLVPKGARTPATAPVGRKGAPLENLKGTPTRNADEVINGRRYTGHALDQAQNRGLTPSVVEDAIQNGRRSADPIPGRTRNFSPDNNITVITEGKDVITVIPGRR